MILQVGQAHSHRPRVALPHSFKFPNEGVQALLDQLQLHISHDREGVELTRNEMDLRRGRVGGDAKENKMELSCLNS
jgi:hypothetical protein